MIFLRRSYRWSRNHTRWLYKCFKLTCETTYPFQRFDRTCKFLRWTNSAYTDPSQPKRTLGRVPIEPSLDASFANVDVPRLAYLPYSSSEVPKVDFVPHTSRSRPPWSIKTTGPIWVSYGWFLVHLLSLSIDLSILVIGGTSNLGEGGTL